MGTNRSVPAALTGVLFFLLAVAAIIVQGGEPPGVDDPAREIVAFWREDDTRHLFSAALGGLATTALVFFGGYVRSVLRVAEGRAGYLPAVAFAGIVILATGLAIDGMIVFALSSESEDLSPQTIVTLNALWHNDFMPMAVGLQIFLLGMALSILAHGGLPKWLGYIALVLAVIAVTPIGFAAFIATFLLIPVISVLLALRARREGAAPPSGPAAPAEPPAAEPVTRVPG